MRARDNPFRTSSVLAVRYRLLSGSWAGLMDRLDDQDYRAEIEGPGGSGKTTLLEDLAARLAREGFTIHWVRLTADDPRLPATLLSTRFGPREILLIDGADLLRGRDWRRLRRGTREAGGLVVTTHRSGMLPTLVHCETTPGLLWEILRELLDQEADGMHQRARELFHRHNGNLRGVLRELYDQYAAGTPEIQKRDFPGAREICGM